MSYILEALKKADRERTIGEVPDLESAHWGVRQSSGKSRWPWVVAGLLAFNAALLVYLLGRSDADEEPAQEVSAGDLPASHEPVSQVAAVPLERLETPVPDRPRAPRPRVNHPPPVAEPVNVPAVRPSSASAGQPKVVVSPAPLTAGEVDSALPEWGELPLEFRSGFPLPHIDVYVYADESARRFVLIDLKKYREGDTLANGALLEKIGPASIQLSYEGTRFRVNR